MIGLLKKDFFLLSSQRVLYFVICIILLAVVLGHGEPMQGVFVSTMLLATLATTTISYDDFNHGFQFLFTLPITKRTYVYEKYILSFVLSVLGVILSGILVSLVYFTRIQEIGMLELVSQFVLAVLIPNIFTAILIPIHLKFGSEKSRYVLIGLILLVSLVVSFLFKEINVVNVTNFINNFSDVVLMLAMLVFAIISVIISSLISNKIMKSKSI